MRGADFNWAAHIEAVARRLCGEPNKQLSSKTELRFGSHGSLSVRKDKGTFYDHENKTGGGTLDLIRHKLGVSNGAAVEWLKTELKVDMPETRIPPTGAPTGVVRIVATRTYEYRDEQGQALFQAIRQELSDGSKKMWQRHRGADGEWVQNIRGVRRVLYRLPELLEADPERAVFIAEGEKKVEALRELDLVATCNPMGAGKWLPEFREHFCGATVMILPDNDDTGRAHAADIVRSLLGVADEVRVVALPGLPEKGDIIDWLAAGGTREELLKLADAAEPVREMPAAASAAAASGARNVVPFRRDTPGDSEQPTEPSEDSPALLGEPLNDIGNAKRLLDRHRDLLLYVVSIGWHVWDGRRYQYDPATVHARKLAHETIRTMLGHAFDMPKRNKDEADLRKAIIKFCVGSGNTGKVNGMLSQAEPNSAVTTDDLDRDPWLLNCANGTLDLRTLELRSHSQGDRLTKLAPVAYRPDAKCPIWTRVISEIFNKDNEMIEFVQRAIGYSLTGLTTEQIIFILHGAGSNGKSLMLEIIAAILGDYAAQCASDTFVENTRGSGIPNDIARLVGARFVSAVETEQDRKLQEAMIKQATGGDRLTARFMRQEFFEFIPHFKLWMATNHKPRVRGTDNAIWRRIRLLPFLVIFADEGEAAEGQPIKDLLLKDKLMQELEGIFKWMVDGCVKWQKHGLTKAPKAVMEATTEYRESQDATAGFVEECCHVAPSIHVKVGSLYKAYKNWCIANAETPLSSTAFGLALEEKGFASGKGTNGVRERKGLTLKLEFDPDHKPDEDDTR
jgi:putative DNA primase/helicase